MITEAAMEGLAVAICFIIAAVARPLDVVGVVFGKTGNELRNDTTVLVRLVAVSVLDCR